MKSSEYEKLNETQLGFLDYYDVEYAFPTFLVFNDYGNLTERTTRFMNSNEFMEFGNTILKQKGVSGNNVP